MKTAFILALSLQLALPTFGQASTPDARRQLIKAVEVAGYSSVRVEGCMLSFWRRFVPTTESGSISGVRYFINLSYLDFAERSEVERLSGGDLQYWELTVATSSEYFLIYRPFIAFRAWVRDTYPKTDWPLFLPNADLSVYKRIEMQLERDIDQKHELIRSEVQHADIGPVTSVHLLASIVSEDREALLVLAAELERASLACIRPV